MSSRIWIAAGTTEGRLLAEEVADENIELAVTVATEYGASLIIDKPNVSVLDKRLNDRGMAEFIDQFKPDLAIDATHPYAAMVTETMRRVCEKKGVVYKRLLRPPTDEEDCLRFSSVEEAAAWLDKKEGIIKCTFFYNYLLLFNFLASVAFFLAAVFDFKTPLVLALSIFDTAFLKLTSIKFESFVNNDSSNFLIADLYDDLIILFLNVLIFATCTLFFADTMFGMISPFYIIIVLHYFTC